VALSGSSRLSALRYPQHVGGQQAFVAQLGRHGLEHEPADGVVVGDEDPHVSDSL
jgi:hypothetical protein